MDENHDSKAKARKIRVPVCVVEPKVRRGFSFLSVINVKLLDKPFLFY
jgi:hypothetical protein